MPANTNLRHMNWLLSGLALLFVLVWQAPAFYSVQGLASYLPVHMSAETFSIVISMLVFGVTWNAYTAERPSNIVILACALLAAGLIDFAHMLSFKGMPDFITPSGPEKAINLWLSGRLVVALALLVVALRPWRSFSDPRARYWLLAGSLAVTALVVWAGLVHTQAWPRTFIPGEGLTPFKVGAEYAIIAVMLVPAVVFYRQAQRRPSDDMVGLFAATVITILAELSFTLYSDVADVFNLLGHLYKIVAYAFIYRAVFALSVRDPFQRLDAEFAENQRISQELRTASLYTRSLVEASLDPLVTISAEGKITDVNRATEKVTGFGRDELIGTDFSDYFTEPERAREGYQQVFQKGAVIDYPLALRHRDGRVTDVLYNASVYRNDAGEVLGVFAAARDVTELKKSSQYARSLIEASLDPLVTISAEGKITDVNQATEKVTGYGRGELIGTDFSDYFTEPERAREGYRQVFQKGSVIDYPLVLRHRDGHVTDVLYNASVYRDAAGAVLGVFAAARDVTERNRAEQEVAQLSLQNKLILESVGEGIYGLGLDGRCTFVNPTAAQLLGFSVEELVGEHAHYQFHHTKPDGRPYPEEECPVQTAYKLGEVHRGDDLYWRKDGSSFPVEFISTPILEAGKVTGAVVTFRDITERKLAEEKLRRSEHGLAEAQRIAHLGNWELDLVHNVLIWSDEIYRIFEIDPDKFGASYEAFLNGIHPDDRDMVNKAYTDSVSSRVPYNIVHRLKMPDGRIKYVNEMCETYYAEDGKPLRSVGTVHDITERKLAEEEIKALNRDLEQRVIERTAQLEAANKELEAFSYSVSHDLRTPLRAIDGFSHILLEDYTDKLDDEGKRLLNVVRDNTNKMGQLIDDILKFSRAGRLELTPVEIDMEKMAHEVLEELQPVVDASRLQLEIEPLPHASGDRAMMRQVFVNLLSNALKFSRERSPARIKVGASSAGDETVYYVKDNGAGFDMQYAGKLFGVFQRLHGVTEFEGTGIGLAIVKRIVARHGGRVWAEGKLNEGATMYFALPRTDRSGPETDKGD